jgi:Ca2+-binding RTX toxin-like protein
MRDARRLEMRNLVRSKREFDNLTPGLNDPLQSDFRQSAGLTTLLDRDPRFHFPGTPSGALTGYSLTPSSTTVTEGNSSITFTITRSGDRPAETIYASTLFDTARSPGDYDGLVNQAITFSSGQTSKTFTVGINDDTTIESTEHFRVMIAHNTSDGSAQAIDISDIFIQDNDTPATAQYSLTPSSTTKTEGNTSITFTITRSGAFPAETIYASTLFDTAHSPGDYDGLVNQAISFSSGQTSRTFTVDINDDNEVESTEHFRVMIAHNTSDGSGQALDISDVFIEDNDTATTAQYSLTPSSTTQVEANGSITFTITRSGAFPPETLYASTLFDTASSPSDYDGLVNFAISFASGQISKTFTVDINDDSLVESTEHFRVMIAHNTGDGSAQALDISDIFIEDNDSISGPSFTIESAGSVTEGNNAVFLVTMHGFASTPVTVWYSTLSGTASAAAGDYPGTFVDQALTFNPGDPSTKSIVIPILVENPNLPENNETFSVGLQSSQHSSAYTSASITIISNGSGQVSADLIANDVHTSGLVQKDVKTASMIDPSDLDGNVVDADYFQTTLTGGHRYTFSGDANINLLDTLDQLFIRLRDSSGKVLANDPSSEGATPSFYFDVPGSGNSTYYLAVSAGGSGFSDKTGAYSIIFHDAGLTPILVPAPSITPNWADLVNYRTYLNGGQINPGLEPGSNPFLISLLGTPSIVNQTTPPKVNIVTQQIAGVQGNLQGMDKAILSLSGIFSKVFQDHPDLYGHVNANPGGMLSIRLKRPTTGSSSDISDHAWGIAIDLTIDGLPLDQTPDEKLARGLAILIPYFNAAGWASGAGWGVYEDDMHFEVSTRLLSEWFGTTASTQGDQALSLVGDEQHTLLAIAGDAVVRTDIRLGAQGEQVLVTRGGSGEAVLQATQYSEIAFTGGLSDDELTIGSLDGTHVAMSTIFYYGMDGNDRLDASSADRRVVADGGVGNDYLIGGLGDDIFAGGAGDDTFIVGGADTVLEIAGEGYDNVAASASYTLTEGAYVEVLSTTDHAGTAAINLTGNEVGQFILGNAGMNALNGGAGGGDILAGFGGDDTYFVDADDQVREDVGGGFDYVVTTTSYALNFGAEIELLGTTDNAGTAAIDLTGNNFAQVIIGNAGMNSMRGGPGGGDVLVGFGGNDTYFVDGDDQIREDAGGGFDYVVTSTSYALNFGAEIELLGTVDNAGTGNFTLTGNNFAQVIIGNAGDNVMNGGGGGADVLNGFAGNDTLFVDADDIVREEVGNGYDYVVVKSSYTLNAGAEIELMTTTDNAGTSAFNLTGNEFANIIQGNQGANVLNGGLGLDRLVGLGGADGFAFTTTLGGNNVDTLVDFVHGTDKILLGHAIFAAIGMGALASSAFATGATAADGDDRIVYNSANGGLFYDADGAGGTAAVQFATLQPGLGLTASDFQVI